jgi:hypothetical protein
VRRTLRGGGRDQPPCLYWHCDWQEWAAGIPTLFLLGLWLGRQELDKFLQK